MNAIGSNAELFNDLPSMHTLKYMIVALFTSDIHSFTDKTTTLKSDDIEISRCHVTYNENIHVPQNYSKVTLRKDGFMWY